MASRGAQLVCGAPYDDQVRAHWVSWRIMSRCIWQPDGLRVLPHARDRGEVDRDGPRPLRHRATAADAKSARPAPVRPPRLADKRQRARAGWDRVRAMAGQPAVYVVTDTLKTSHRTGSKQEPNRVRFARPKRREQPTATTSGVDNDR
jgi:hypothetical protein